MEKAYCLLMNSSNLWYPKECRIIWKGEQDTIIEFEDQDGNLKRRTIPSKYAFQTYQDAKNFIRHLYTQGKRH